jgi:hypothetical protein
MKYVIVFLVTAVFSVAAGQVLGIAVVMAGR